MLDTMIAEPEVCSHWSGFNLPGRALGEAEATGYARACWPSGTDAEIQFLAIQIATMTALDDAFDAVTDCVDPRSIALLVPWRGRAAPEALAARNIALGPEWEGMRAALAALDQRLAQLAPGSTQRRTAVRAWWRQMAERQIVAFAAEAAWRIQGAVPDLQTYLGIGQQSIGVEWTAASLIALDPAASLPPSGNMLSRAIYAIARAIRMANDLHDPERERKEGKVQWVLLRSRELVRLRGLDAEHAEAAAALELKALATGEAGLARTILRGSSSRQLGGDALRAGLEGLLGIGLATYVPELAIAV